MKKSYSFAVNLCAIHLIVFAPVVAAASKPVMGVAEFRNTAHAYWWRGGVGWELSEMLTNELAGTGKFRMVERRKLQHVIGEQDLGASGRANPATAAKIGKLTGARYLVMGTVSAFERNTQDTGGGISFGGVSLGGKMDEAYLAIDLRVVDTTTGEIGFTRTVEARSSGSGIRVGVHRGGFGGNLRQEENTPVGKAIRAVIVEASDYLACVMVEKNECVSEFKQKEKTRRSKTKGAVSLD